MRLFTRRSLPAAPAEEAATASGISSIPFPLLHLSEAGRVVAASDAALTLLDIRASKVLFAPYPDLADDSLRPEALSGWLECLVEGSATHHLRTSRAGHRIDAHLARGQAAGSGVYAQLEMVRPVATAEPITVPDAITRTLGETARRLTDCVLLLNYADHIVFANDGFAATFITTADEAKGKHVASLASAGNAESSHALDLAERIRAGRRGPPWAGELTLYRSDGSAFPAQVYITPTGSEDGALLALVLRDLTLEKRRAEELARSQRLSVMGEMLAGVAHELKNPLGNIGAWVQHLLARLDCIDEDELRSRLRDIWRNVERGDRIVSQLKLMAREDGGETRAAVDLASTAAHLVSSRQQSLAQSGSRLVLEMIAPPVGLATTWGDATRIEQAIDNLIVNATHAARAVIRLAVSAPGPEVIRVTVEDDGAGIPEDVAQRIFDPFYTTKVRGVGIGLGLSLAHSVASSHGGSIRVSRSQDLSGARFDFDLPALRSDQPAPVGDPIQSPEPLSRNPLRTLRVLLTDDEDAPLIVIGTALRARGHHVDEARDGTGALAMVRAANASGTPYDVMTSDFWMSGLNGRDLVKALAADGIGMERKLVFLTGSVADAETRALLQEFAVPVIHKPFSVANVVRTLECLAG